MNYLTEIENRSDNALDMLTNKNTKCLFYQFSQHLAQIGRLLKLIKHNVIADKNYGLSYKKKNGTILLNVC